MQLTFMYTQVPSIVYTTFLQRVDSSSIVGRGNRIRADMLCQNQIDLLTGASFIQWAVVCTHPFLFLNKKTALKEKKPYDLLYSWYLSSRCFIVFVDCWCNFIYLFQLSVAMIYDRVVDCIEFDLTVLFCSLLVIGYFLLATYCCAC